MNGEQTLGEGQRVLDEPWEKDRGPPLSSEMVGDGDRRVNQEQTHWKTVIRKKGIL
jgi:hypothetical protein